MQDIVITPPPEEDEAETTDFPDNGYNGKWIIRAHTAEDGEQVFYFELLASNGEKLLSRLTAKYNHERQESITSELIDASAANFRDYTYGGVFL